MKPNLHWFYSLGSYLSNETLCSKICQGMYLSGDFENLRESLKSKKMNPLITWFSVKQGEILLIFLWLIKCVLLHIISSKRYQMKVEDLIFNIISNYYKNYRSYCLKNVLRSTMILWASLLWWSLPIFFQIPSFQDISEISLRKKGITVTPFDLLKIVFFLTRPSSF